MYNHLLKPFDEKGGERMEGIELVCFKMISALGAAKSSFMEAIQEAKQGHFERAHQCIEEGEKYHVEGHEAHFGLLQKETAGEHVDLNLLLVHAEDQLMSAEFLKITAEEIIAVYEKLEEKFSK